MSTVSLPVTSRPRSLPPRFLLSGILVGLLDIIAPIVLYVFIRDVTTMQRVLQSVAGGVLGKATFDGGAATATLGLVLHFTIAFLWTTAYYVIVRRWGALARAVSTVGGAVVVGILVGTFVCLAMYEVVVPLSRAGASPPLFSRRFLTPLLIHWFFVGLPMVLAARDGRAR